MTVALFTTSAYEDFGQRLSRSPALDLFRVERKRFGDGERYQRIRRSAELVGRHVALIGGTIDDTATLELYDLACQVVDSGAFRLTVVVPYFGYSTMERSTRAGEVVVAEWRANLLSAIPRPPAGIEVVLFDLHSEAIKGFFDHHRVRAHHRYCEPVILKAIQELGGDDFVLGSADEGRAKWVRSYANRLGVATATILKRRDGEATEVEGIGGDVANRHVVIYDDMIRSGGSLVGAARTYQLAGARSIAAVATHGVLPEGAVKRLRESRLLACVAVTDTHPCAMPQRSSFLRVYSVTGLIREILESSERSVGICSPVQE